MSKINTVQPAMTVILTDREQAVLFTLWKEEDIANESREHFPDGNITMYAYPRFSSDMDLPGWPCYPKPIPGGRRHVVPFEEVAHIIGAARLLEGRR